MAQRHHVSGDRLKPDLVATRYTRYLNKDGYLRFHHWKLYGERGLASHPVTIWVYDGTLKIEYQAVLLSQYSVELQEDRKHLRQVSNARLVDTPFRSPQWTLFDLGPNDWLLYVRLPEYTARRRRRKMNGLVQPELFDAISVPKAAGAEDLPPRLRLVPPQEEEHP